VLKKIHFNLNHKNNISLNENSYTDFSNDVYFLMQSLYGGQAPELKVTMGGSPSQITSFFTALQREKRYMDSFIKHGLNDAQSTHSKWQLQDAVDQFEFETGLKWPFVQ
jgi:hypothetical protein